MVESSYVEEQLAIQVNLFDCGGIAVGVSIISWKIRAYEIQAETQISS